MIPVSFSLPHKVNPAALPPPGPQTAQMTVQKLLPQVAKQHSDATLQAMRPLVAEVQEQQHQEMALKQQQAELQQVVQQLTAKLDQIFAALGQAPQLQRNGQ